MLASIDRPGRVRSLPLSLDYQYQRERHYRAMKEDNNGILRERHDRTFDKGYLEDRVLDRRYEGRFED